MVRPEVVGEFCGTLVLILLGDGVVAGVLLERSKAQNAGWIAITTGWALAVMCGILVSQALGGPGSLNPVGPLVNIVVDGKPVAENLALVAAQFAGAFSGAALVWLHYLPHWELTADPALKLGVFCNAPAVRNTAANLLSEFIGTFVLIFVALSLAKLETGGATPPFVGGLVWAIGLCLGGTTGYAINPARDLAPRVAHAVLPIAGKGGSDWGYAWIPVVGPCLGGLAAGWAFTALGHLS